MTERLAEAEQVLENCIRPKLQLHGGNAEITAFSDGVLHIRLTGNCRGCPSSKYTIESLIKEEMTEKVSGIHDVWLVEEVNSEMIAFAKQLLNKSAER